MSITSRINEMSSHIEQAYDELQGLGADLTNVNKNIENISMVLDDIYDSMPQVSGEGTSLTLDDTRVGKIKSTLKGNTSQTTYSGKNLFKVSNGTFTKNGVTATIKDSIITLNGTATANVYLVITSNEDRYSHTFSGNYTISKITSATTIGSALYGTDSGGTDRAFLTINDNASTKTQAINETYTSIRAQLNIPNGATFSNTIVKIQLESGSSATDFEPFVGGTASPNPSYPQPVNVVSGDNEINVCGKNLYSRDNGQYNVPTYATDGTSASYQDVNVVWVKVKPNTDYSFTLLPNSQTYFVRIIECTGDKDFIYRFPNNYRPGSGVANTLTITTKNNCEWLQIAINQYQTSQISQNNWEVMIEKSSTPSTYESYQGNTYNIDLPEGMELCKIGNYQDYFYKDSGKWYLHKEIGTYKFTGNELIGIYTTPDTTRRIFYVVSGLDNIENYTTSSEVPRLLSNYFVSRSQADTWPVGTISRRTGASAYGYFYLSVENNPTTEEFALWLSGNNINVQYVLTTPTGIEITYQPLIDQLNLLEKAQSKDGQTNISQVNNDLPFIISASALKEWQESTSLNSTLSMVNPLSLGNTLNTQENNTQPIEVDNIEPLEEEENEES